MAVATRSALKRWDWRGIVFKAVSGLIALFFLTNGGVFSLLFPWVNLEGPHFEVHRWHEAQWGGLTAIIFAGSLLALMRRSREKPLLVQFLVLGGIVFTLVDALVVGFDPLFLLLIAFVAITYPTPRALLSFSREGPISRPLLVLSLLAVTLLAPDAWHNLRLQLSDVSEHATMNHWMIGVDLALLLSLAGMLAATKRPGWQALGIVVGIALVYLGLAALTLPAYDGSWGITGGMLSTLGGVGYITITLLEARKGTRTTTTMGRLRSE